MSKERVSLYFNTDIPIEKEMWDFISKDGRKSQKIKRAIEDAMNASKVGINHVIVKNEITTDNQVNNNEDEEIQNDELEGSDEGMNL